MEKFMDIEERVSLNVDLLQIAKDYCEFNIDKSIAIGTLMPLIEITLKNQKDIITNLDRINS